MPSDDPVRLEVRERIAEIRLHDPARRNALGEPMFDGLERTLDGVRGRDDVRVVLLAGAGAAFCAGFDLASAAERPELMATFIRRLSRVNRSLRRLAPPVVAAVQGAAIAGGCALLSACDFVVVSRSAKLGYPVHRIGVSPAVTIPTLAQAVGPGPARALLLGGELIDGRRALALGLASHLSPSDDEVREDALKLCRDLAAKPPGALQATKAWLNELDGSGDDAAFEAPLPDSVALTRGEEARRLLQAAWGERSRRS